MQQNLHTVSRSINSQAAQIRNSLSCLLYTSDAADD